MFWDALRIILIKIGNPSTVINLLSRNLGKKPCHLKKNIVLFSSWASDVNKYIFMRMIFMTFFTKKKY